jgi:hypothetical protein
MASLARRLAATLLLGGFAVVCSAGGNAADDKTPSCEDVMSKVNGKKGLVAKVGTAAKGDKWDDAQKLAKEIKDLGAALGKNDPPRGSKESWAKLTKKYEEQTAAIADAADKKDAAAVTKATDAFTAKENCAACHGAHKPKK